MELQRHLQEFEAAGIAVFSVSYDSVEVLAGFAEEHGIRFPLLSDEGSSVIKRFGILNTLIRPEEDFYGIPSPAPTWSTSRVASWKRCSGADTRCATAA